MTNEPLDLEAIVFKAQTHYMVDDVKRGFNALIAEVERLREQVIDLGWMKAEAHHQLLQRAEAAEAERDEEKRKRLELAPLMAEQDAYSDTLEAKVQALREAVFECAQWHQLSTAQAEALAETEVQ